MPRGGAHFTPDEIQDVLSRYDIGNIIQIKTLNAGSAAAPKKIVLSDSGKFLLKRRAKDKSDIYHVAFSHAIQSHLEEKGFHLQLPRDTRIESIMTRIAKGDA